MNRKFSIFNFFYRFFPLGILLFFTSCSHLFYHPKHQMIFNPTHFGYEYRDVEFKSLDGTFLHGWFFPAVKKKKERGTIIQFHGNGENITSHFLSLAWVTKEGYNLFTFDYQGYGLSKGEATQQNLHNDAVAALEWALDYNRSRGKELLLVAYGQSLGGAVLMHALSNFEKKNAINAAVIDSSFPSYTRIAREKLAMAWTTWLFQPLAYLLVSNSHAPEEEIAKITPTRLLVIHGDADKIVPYHHGKKIYDLAKTPKTLWTIPGGKHIDSMTKHDEKYRKRFLKFLERL